MGRILCITNGLAGMLYSSLELARRLSAAGHDVTYMSFPFARTTVVDHDVPFEPLAPSRYDEFLMADATKSTFERLRTVRQRREVATDAVAVGDLADRIRTVDPELLLIDCEMQEQIMAAWAIGVPIALLNSFVSIWKRPGLPPPHRLVRPGQGWQGSPLGISLFWRELRLRKARKASWQKVQHVGCDRLSVLHRLAAKSGFELRDEADFDQWLIPFIFPRFPVLSLHALEFDFPHEPAAEVHYVGPMVLGDRIDSRVSQEERAELESVFERRGSSDGRRSLIYAGFGSTFTADIPVLKRLIAAVASREDWDLLISLGERYTPADLELLPANVHAFPWLPQTTVLQHADVVVSHGGINTIDESVLAAVPMLLFCGFETDMAGSSARLAQHEIGIVGSRKRDTAQSIVRQIHRLLTESRFRSNLERLRSCYLAYAENRVAERVVDGLLERRSPDH